MLKTRPWRAANRQPTITPTSTAAGTFKPLRPGTKGHSHMTRSLTKHRTVAAVAATLALGIVPAADARPIDTASRFFPPTAPPQTPATTVHATNGQPNGSDISDWGYVAIGSGVASLALIGAAGTRAASRRRRQRTTVQPRVAA